MLVAFQGSAASSGGKKTGGNFRYLPDGALCLDHKHMYHAGYLESELAFDFVRAE